MSEPLQIRVAVLAGQGADELANQLGLAVTGVTESSQFDAVFAPSDRGLELRWLGPDGRLTPLRVDFADPPTRPRATAGRRSLLARAIGCHRGVREVVDATAGLGRDAFSLACLGCHVVLIERSPLLVPLLADALQRLRCTTPALADQLQLVPTDAASYLGDAALRSRPEVVYLDPMFPDHGRRALPKLELQVLRALLGSADAESTQRDLLGLARRVATRRVVVKRRNRNAPLGDRPNASVAGTQMRFDIYTPINPSTTT